MSGWWLVAATALAQDEEIVVYGELLVEQAHQAVIQELKDLGYDGEIVDRGDYVVYRHEAPWHGEVRVYDDGWMHVKRQPLRVEGREVPWAKKNTPVAWAGCLLYPWACLRVNGALVGERKWRGTETRTVDRVQPKVQEWGDRIADLAVERKVGTLPDRLQALWDHGTPLEGGPALQSWEQRRAALLAYWSSRTDTPWGEQVRDAVAAFCRAVVQHSENPFTPEELAGAGLEL